MTSLKAYLWLVVVMAITVGAALGISHAANVRLVVLWSDALIYLLVVAIAAFAIEAVYKEHLRAPWRHVARRPLAMSALVVLLFYVVIGLLDSVHFRQALEPQEGQTEVHYSGEELSLLDVIATPLRERQEKTYSAPFATHLFMKETLEIDGRQVRDYPRLTYAGAHLEDPQRDKAGDIVWRTTLALLETLVLSAIILVIVAAAVAKPNKTKLSMAAKAILYNQTTIPWLAMLITFTIMLFLLMFAVNFAGYYLILGTDKVGP